MPNKIVSRETVDLIAVEHECVPGYGELYRTHTNTGELSRGDLRWYTLPPLLHYPACDEKLPQNISEVEETPSPTIVDSGIKRVQT